MHAFDYDPQSVACTRELQHRFFPGDAEWTVESGSVLDRDRMRALGQFDVVYSWGVLHHTGSMWDALANAAIPVAQGGKLVVAIYNDMGSQSRRWRWVKKTYNELPAPARVPFAIAVTLPAEVKALAGAVLRRRPGDYVCAWTDYPQPARHESPGTTSLTGSGLPVRVCDPRGDLRVLPQPGIHARQMKCGGVGLGCNEFGFTRVGESNAPALRSRIGRGRGISRLSVLTLT